MCWARGILPLPDGYRRDSSLAQAVRGVQLLLSAADYRCEQRRVGLTTSKEAWPKPAAWAITQNERLWTKFDSITDRSSIIEWSLGDTYRTRLMAPGDRAVFWITGPNGGLARVGFVLRVKETPGHRWLDANEVAHDAPWSGEFFMPPFPNNRYIHRGVLQRLTGLAQCELVTTAAQGPLPLRIEHREWRLIENNPQAVRSR